MVTNNIWGRKKEAVVGHFNELFQQFPGDIE
jgi:hypothetical protein